MKHEIAVVGGGPAGCVAASHAAGMGDVIIFEEHERQPVHCAGLVSSSGFRVLGLSPGDFVLNEIRGARLYSPMGGVIEVKDNNVRAYVVDRSAFDGYMLDRALGSGVCFENRRVTSIKNRMLLAGGRKYKADKVILATGTDYNLQKKSRLNCPREFLFGAQYEMRVACERDTVEMHFVVPGFFAWLIPAGDRTRVGLCARDNPTPHLRKFIKKLYGQRRLKSKKIFDRSFGIIPVYNPHLKTEHPYVNLVGDAAGHVKATTGGGVVMGGIAAQYAGSRDYERLWRRSIGSELLLHLRVYRLVSGLSAGNMERLFRMISDSSGFLEAYGDMDYASKTLRGLFRNPWFTLRLLLHMPSFVFDLL